MGRVKISRRCIPYTPNRRPLADLTIALVTTAGVHLRSQEPFNVEGDYSYCLIPGDVAADDLAVTHGHYDHADADRDVNLVFPIDRLRELAAAGEIGGVGNKHVGTMGTSPNLTRFYDELVPAVADEVEHSQADAVLLTAG